MDPCSFVKVLVGGLALRVPVSAKPTRTGIHPTASPCFCEIKLPNLPAQIVTVPLISPKGSEPDVHLVSASFHLEKIKLQRLQSCWGKNGPCLKVALYTGRQGSTCGVALGKLLGKFKVNLDLEGANERPVVFHNGWVSLGNSRHGSAELHLNVRAEPDLRYVFQFDGEIGSSPQVLQIQGNIRQPIFSCMFTSDRAGYKRSMNQEDCNQNKHWLTAIRKRKGKAGERKERKGWLVMIHDLSGYPVAAASMITPFVPSPGSDRVSKANPGEWLILRPDGKSRDSWKPWGRLEAWRERGSSGALGCKFELIADVGNLMGRCNALLLAESIISAQKGGKFIIDSAHGRSGSGGTPFSCSPASTPRGSGDFSFNNLLPYTSNGGFVMSTTVSGENNCSKPMVQLGTRYVTCMEDAAVFVALSAAVDLSMAACQVFSKKLKRHFCQKNDSS